MGIALLEIAEESGFKIKNEILDNIMGFWDCNTEIPLYQKIKKVSGRTGILANKKTV